MKTEEELSCEKASEIFQMVSFWDDRDEREIMIIISFCFSLTNTTVEFSFSQISVALGVCVCVFIINDRAVCGAASMKENVLCIFSQPLMREREIH